ncbi:hypothetical protein BD779DRAFT_1672316 [Infundibulicybe gibba]|nr:hypothetical protein BD779DRAFT_1672316 [Infundibulicybe gibba]
MRFALSYIIIFRTSISLTVLASPSLVEGAYDVEAIPNVLLSDGYVAPGDGVVIANLTLVPRADPGGSLALMQQGKDLLNIIQAVINASKKDNAACAQFLSPALPLKTYPHF